MMTVEDMLEQLAEFPKHAKVVMSVETEDTRDPKNPFFFQRLEIQSLKFEDDEVLIEHE